MRSLLPRRAKPWLAAALSAFVPGLVAATPPAAASAAAAAPTAAPLQPCRLTGVETPALCGRLVRPLDPTRPEGLAFELHYAVLPAVARQKKPDPVFLFAGGPGQSAMALAGSASRLLARLNNRRDIVLVDQRGTGRSAPLHCDDGQALQPLAESVDPQRQRQRLRDCAAQLQRLPHGDLRLFTTTLAVQDVDAVRQALGATQINLVGASYGTRAALEYQRQFPQTVRRAVLDGLAPPDMVLPATFSADGQAALEQVWAACTAEPACAATWPTLRGDWARLLASLPRTVEIRHPLSGAPERLVLDRDAVLGLVRAPLYAPALAAALPAAVALAAAGRFDALVGLATSLGGGSRATRMAVGMHFSVVCAEDAPRLAAARAAGEAPGADFGDGFERLYGDVCAFWPRGEVPAAFYTLPTAPAAALLLSGGAADPATPPRHGARVATALGAKARHVVVPQAGHGVMALPCVRDLLFRFIDAPDDSAALQVDTGCAQALPRPGAFLPPGTGTVPGAVTGSSPTGGRP